MIQAAKPLDLSGRLLPKQHIHNHPVTFSTSILAGRAMSRTNRKALPSRLPPIENQTAPRLDFSDAVSSEEVVSPFKFVEYVREIGLDGDFVYLLPQNIEENEENPTRLRIVPSSQIPKDDFWTLSRAGLSHVKNSVVEFMPLDDWLRSCDLFKQVMKIPFFKHYRQWKSFTSWKRDVARDQMIAAGNSLRDHLFIVHPILRPTFFGIQKEIQSLKSLKLFNLRGDSLYSLNEFSNDNARQRERISKTLEEFIGRITEMVQVACEKTIDTLSSLTVTEGAVQQSPLDHVLQQYEKAAHRGVRNAFDNGPSLTFTQRAANRTLCAKLVKFIKLVDACIVSALRNICFTSLLELYCIMRSLHCRGLRKLDSSAMDPLPELPLSSEWTRIFGAIQQKATDFFETPVFRVDVAYKGELRWTPCEKHVTDVVDTMRRECLQIIYAVPRLIHNQAFRQYISPDGTGDRSKREMICAPDLAGIIERDKMFNDLVSHQDDIVKEAFKSLSTFSACYKEAMQIFDENEKFSIDALIQSRISAQALQATITKYNSRSSSLRRSKRKVTSVCFANSQRR
jgi:dynein heavy chain